MENKIKIETSIFAYGLIEQITSNNPTGSIADIYMRTVLDTQNNQIVHALISLGWTPPPTSTKKNASD